MQIRVMFKWDNCFLIYRNIMSEIEIGFNKEDLANLEKLKKYEEARTGKKLTINDVISITIQEVHKRLIKPEEKQK